MPNAVYYFNLVIELNINGHDLMAHSKYDAPEVRLIIIIYQIFHLSSSLNPISINFPILLTLVVIFCSAN